MLHCYLLGPGWPFKIKGPALGLVKSLFSIEQAQRNEWRHWCSCLLPLEFLPAGLASLLLSTTRHLLLSSGPISPSYLQIRIVIHSFIKTTLSPLGTRYCAGPSLQSRVMKYKPV